jgi:simple sugar transport system permease protein
VRKESKEPLIHITKRRGVPWQKAWLIRIIAIALALVICAIVTTAATGLDPVGVYGTMLEGAFGTERKVWILGKETAVLLCISIAMAPAFRMKFWNLGGEGQVLIGAWMTAACMIVLGDSLPGPLLILVMLVSSILIGALWAGIPAFFKAKWNTNETLFTLMMNYVAIQLVAYYIIVWESPKGSGKVGIINQMTRSGWLPSIGNYQYLLNILIVAVLTVLVYVYLKYSKQGYEVTVVGESQNTARYVGINVKEVIIRTMLISGGIYGIAGMLMVAGTDHSINTNTMGGQGFTAIMISWLGQFNPFIMSAMAGLVTFLKTGAAKVADTFFLNSSYSDIVSGIVILFLVGCEFFIQYSVRFRHTTKGGAE